MEVSSGNNDNEHIIPVLAPSTSWLGERQVVGILYLHVDHITEAILYLSWCFACLVTSFYVKYCCEKFRWWRLLLYVLAVLVVK